MGRPKKSTKVEKVNVSVENLSGFANGMPEEVDILVNGSRAKYIQKEDQLYYVFDFCKWLELLPKGSVGGATQLARAFFREKGMYDD